MLQVNKNLIPVKNINPVYLRLLFTYLHQNDFIIKKHLALVLKASYAVGRWESDKE